jgi:hypothetical protein
MKRHLFVLGLWAVLIGLALTARPVHAQAPLGGGGDTAFTYQGQLVRGGVPVNDTCTFRFGLWTDPTAGSQIGGPLDLDAAVADGLFTTQISFGVGAFPGDSRWLRVHVSCPGDLGWIYLGAQEMTSSPYALGLKPGAIISGTPPSVDTPVIFKVIDTSTSQSYAVWGEATGNLGTGVYGTSSGSQATGVAGLAGGYEGNGVFASATGSKGLGVYSYANGDQGEAVYAWSQSNAGRAVHGKMQASNGYGGYFENISGGVALLSSANTTGDVFVVQAGGYPPSYPSFEPVFRVTGAGEVYADGSFHPGGADFAEMMPAAQVGLEPGDVLALAPDGRVVRADRPYQPSVIGVYSTKPGVVGSRSPADAGQIPLAIVGIVPVKATAANGPIAPGDLLVASALPGHAMRAAAGPPAGTVIGKALGTLHSGDGVIEMLVMSR